MAGCIVTWNQLGKWIISFNIYGNWAAEERSVEEKMPRGICQGGGAPVI